MNLTEVLLIAAVPLGLWSSHASAGRPLVVDDAPPVAQGHMEVELGVVQSYPHDGGWERKFPATAFGFGLGKGTEAGFSIQRIDVDPKGGPRRSGFEDLHLNAKYQFMDEQLYFPASALALDLKVPTANRRKDLTSGKTDGGLTLIVTKNFSVLAVDLNLGYLFVDSPRGEDLKNRVHGGIAARKPVHPDWTLVGEITGHSRDTKNGRRQANFQVGARYQANSALALDAALGRSLRSVGTEIQATFGLTWLLSLSF